MDKAAVERFLNQWDRKHTDPLKAFYNTHQKAPSFIDGVLELYLQDKGLEHATSWIIKHHCDNGRSLNRNQLDKAIGKLGELDYWENQLHVLQIIPMAELTKEQAGRIEPEVRKLLESNKKFVKAAAYEAYVAVVKHFPELRPEFVALCENALEKESASVKVKIRRILDALNPMR